MKTGIVFKIDGQKSIILKSDGTFISAKKGTDWKVGDIVSIPQKSKKPTRTFVLRVCAACFAVFLLGGFGLKQIYASPVALISVDVNPSVELIVNRFDQVISSSALNGEGEQILSEAQLKNTKYQDAILKILKAEKTKGYLKTNSNVVLTVYSSDASTESALLSQVQEITDSEVSQYAKQVTTECHAVNKTTVNGAHNHGVTAGKYLYMQELQNLEPETDLSQYTHHSIDDIKSEIDNCKKNHGANKKGHGQNKHGSKNKEAGKNGHGAQKKGSGENRHQGGTRQKGHNGNHGSH